VFEEHPTSEPHQVSRIEAYESSEQSSWDKLMIIELKKYIEVRELLIEKGTTVVAEQVIYQDETRGVCN